MCSGMFREYDVDRTGLRYSIYILGDDLRHHCGVVVCCFVLIFWASTKNLGLTTPRSYMTITGPYNLQNTHVTIQVTLHVCQQHFCLVAVILKKWVQDSSSRFGRDWSSMGLGCSMSS